MNMYSVKFSVNGKSGGEKYIEARDQAAAKRIALGEIQGQAGYAGKKISITSVRRI